MNKSHCSNSKCNELHDTNKITSIFELVKTGNLVNVQTLIEQLGVECLSSRDAEGHTPIHWACYRGHVHLVRHFAAVGGDVNLPTETPPRQRPLHWACVNGNIEIVDILLNAGVSIDELDDKDCTPLIVASQYGKTALAAFLIGRGAHKYCVDTDGDTCLHWAAFKGHSELMRLLIYSGLSPHQKDRYGQAPVHLACIRGCLTAVKELYEEEHVNIVDPDLNSKTPLILAQGRKNLEVIQYLQNKLQSRSSFLPSIDIKSIAFGHPGNGKTAYWFLVLNFLIWAYPMYLLKCLPITWDELQYTHLFYMALNASMWFTLYKAKNTPPGFLLRNTDDYHLTVKQIAFIRDTVDIETTLASLCHTCRLVKPRRSKHCRICNRCIVNFDHHCPYIYNCVGYDNRVWFLLFVICVTVAMEMSVFFAYYMLWRDGRDWLVILGLAEAVFFTVIANLIFTTTVGPIYHALTNLTTNEHVNFSRYTYLKDASGQYHNPYASRGYLHNLLEFLHLRPQRHDDMPTSVKVI